MGHVTEPGAQRPDPRVNLGGQRPVANTQATSTAWRPPALALELPDRRLNSVAEARRYAPGSVINRDYSCNSIAAFTVSEQLLALRRQGVHFVSVYD
jgi:hypothetical protein